MSVPYVLRLKIMNVIGKLLIEEYEMVTPIGERKSVVTLSLTTPLY